MAQARRIQESEILGLLRQKKGAVVLALEFRDSQYARGFHARTHNEFAVEGAPTLSVITISDERAYARIKANIFGPLRNRFKSYSWFYQPND